LSQNAWFPVLRTLGTDFWSEGRLLVSRAQGVFDERHRLVDEKVRQQLRIFLQGFVAFAQSRKEPPVTSLALWFFTRTLMQGQLSTALGREVAREGVPLQIPGSARAPRLTPDAILTSPLAPASGPGPKVERERFVISYKEYRPVSF
jgi:hypothetical protein